MKNLNVICAAVALSAALAAPSAFAQTDNGEYQKLTYLTFDGPVEVGHVALPAGTYRFQLADPANGRDVIKVSSQDGKKMFGTILTMKLDSTKLESHRPSAQPVVMFSERPTGTPQAVRAWIYPQEPFGYEFLYPQNEALKIAKESHERVLTQEGDKIGHVDDTGHFTTSDDTPRATSGQK